MSGALVYVTGPSGAGKDSVLQWLREHVPSQAPVHWARRSITRPAGARGEVHEPLTPDAFDAVAREDGFALQWQANGQRYGIRWRELEPLARGAWVFVNGSRAHAAQARQRFPGLVDLYVTAPLQVLEARIRARGRESEAELRARLARAGAVSAPAGALVVCNDGPLQVAGRMALEALGTLAGWPAIG